MNIKSIVAALALSGFSITVIAAPASANNRDLIAKLFLAPTAAERIRLLDPNSDFIFDFNAPPENATTMGQGGKTVRADRLSFPAVLGNSVSMTVGFIGPCGMNTPHIHPRSAQLNIVVEGRLASMFVPENGIKPIGLHYMEKYQMTVFPQGATHFEFNPDCENATFVASFASEDPGVEQVAQTLFSLDTDVVEADLGLKSPSINGLDLAAFRDQIPPNVALGVHECLKKCNLGGY